MPTDYLLAATQKHHGHIYKKFWLPSMECCPSKSSAVLPTREEHQHG
jgi:hypothetical protein